MNFLQLAKKRYSVRKFTDQKIEKEKLNLILEAGRIAPTAVNYQPQRILVITKEEDLTLLSSSAPYLFNQQLALIVCYDEEKSWKRKFDQKDSGEIDASIVTTHMMLQAEELGIGSTWIGHFNKKELIQAFSIPKTIIPVAILLMGYPTDDSTPHRFHDEKLALSETVFYDRF